MFYFLYFYIYSVPPLLGTTHGVALFESPEFHGAQKKIIVIFYMIE